MYSRLYTHILNHHAAIDHCAAFHHIYNDSSLFGLFASFAPSARSAVIPHLIHQLALLLYRAIPQDELSRAKNQLKSSLAMALESRSVEVEDLGRQVSMRTALRHVLIDAEGVPHSCWYITARSLYRRWQTRSMR